MSGCAVHYQSPATIIYHRSLHNSDAHARCPDCIIHSNANALSSRTVINEMKQLLQSIVMTVLHQQHVEAHCIA